VPARGGHAACPALRVNTVTKESAMPRAAWSAKRERQYSHIKSGLLERGTSCSSNVR
jgi:hypothetical protein